MIIYSLSYKTIGNQYEGNYQASMIDKLARLMNIQESKIILVGNSNLAFGIDSAMLEAAFCMPVVNLGLHGGMGNAFHERAAIQNISNGDIVIICHTTYSDDGGVTDKSLAWITFEYHKSLWKLSTVKDSIIMIPAYSKYWQDCYELWRTGRGNQIDWSSSYNREAFNSYGDITFRPVEKMPQRENIFYQDGLHLPDINDTCVKRLNRLNQYVNDCGAKLVVAGFPIAMGDVSPSEAEYEKFQIELRERLDCDVISDFKDYFFPYDCFYDTSYHLTEEAAKCRTQQLIDDLTNWGMENRLSEKIVLSGDM